MLTAIDAGAEDIVDDGDTWQRHPAHRVAPCARPLEGEGIGVESSDLTMVPQTCIARHRRWCQEVLRLIDALDEHDDVQAVPPTSTSRTPFSRPWSAAVSDTVAVGGPAPNSPCRAPTAPPTGTATAPCRSSRPAGGARLLSRRQHLHPAAHQLRPTSTSSGRSTPRCWPSALSRWRATTVSAPTRAGSPSRCWRTPARPWARRTASSGRSGSTGGRSSCWMGKARFAASHRAVAGLWFRPTDEVVRPSGAASGLRAERYEL